LVTQEQVTLVAAIIAAAAAMTNVVLTKRGTRLIELEKWRRQEESALAARVMVLVRALDEAWAMLADRMDEAPGDWAARANVVSERDEALRLAIAELELIASHQVLWRINELLEQLEIVGYILRPGGGENKVELHSSQSQRVRSILSLLLDAVRSDLGLERRLPSRVRVWRWLVKALGVGYRRAASKLTEFRDQRSARQHDSQDDDVRY
jgi:hypothetical protein